MQSIVDRTEKRAIAEAARGTGELSRAGFVRAGRHADGNAPAENDHVAAVEGSRIADLHNVRAGGHSSSTGEHRRHLGSPGRRSRQGSHHERRLQLARSRERQQRIRCKTRVRHVRFRRQQRHRDAGRLERLDERGVLGPSPLGIDPIAVGVSGERPAQRVAWRSHDHPHNRILHTPSPVGVSGCPISASQMGLHPRQ